MKKNIWILLDNRIGSRHQAEGIAGQKFCHIFTGRESISADNEFGCSGEIVRINRRRKLD